MNSAMPWNVNGVGFDAREAARDAARRQGKSLGEWLHGVIADHADDRGVASREIGGQDRIDAITARLEQMGARGESARRPGRPRDARGETRMPTRRAVETRDESYDHEDERYAARVGASRGNRRLDRQDGDDLLDHAVAAMERRAARAEHRTDQALASMARLLEETQARREREHDDVAALTRKLGELETNLSARFASAEANPVKGSLARLEARLDAIGRRGAAEDGVRRNAQRAASETVADGEEPIRRLEDKLNTILEAVAGPRRTPAAEASVSAMAAVRAAAPAGRRSLGDAIAEISRRQRALESGVAEPAIDPIPSRRHDEAAYGALKSDVDAILARQARSTARDGEIEAMRGEIAAMAQILGGLAPRGSIESLEASIGSLAERIDSSRQTDLRDGVLRPVEAAMIDMRRSLHAIDPRETIGSLQDELRRLGDKVERMNGSEGVGVDRLQRQMEELRATVDAASARAVPVQRLEDRVEALAESIQRRFDAPRDDVAMRRHTETIEQRLDLLATRLDAALNAGRSAPVAADTGRLEALVTGLGERLEAAHAPGADADAMDALQRQVEQLAHRLERSEGELPGLSSSMRDLFAQMDATRTSIESTASQAAREVLKIAAGDTRRSAEPQVPARDPALDTMQDMLGKVVDRLSGMEREIADVRRPTQALPEPAAPDRAPVQPRQKPSAVRPVIGAPAPDIRLGGMEPRHDARMTPPSAKTRPPDAARAPSAAPGADDGRRSDFIAAARRAAATAQAEAAQAEAAAAQAPSDGVVRAGLLARSRDYVSTHRRPMLMGLAAVLMALGTLALVGRVNLFDGGVQIAATPSPVNTALAAPAQAPAKFAAAAMAETPAAAGPRDGGPQGAGQAAPPVLGNPIPGSDPIQTGSIPSLPSFAASAPPPRPMLPAGLVAAAQGGDAAAQYMLGAQYADGRAVPRDVHAAIALFEKAAAAGSAPAQYRLGLTYEKGLGLPADKAKAKALYVKAADAGNPRAMHNLAVMLADGDGHPDYAGAVSWFRKAAQFGVHDSQYNLAVLLGRGLGAQQNLIQSYQWFAVAAAAGDVDAGKKRDEVGLKLAADDLVVAKALAASFQPKTPDPVAVDVVTPPGGWDGAPGASRLNSAKSKISSL